MWKQSAAQQRILHVLDALNTSAMLQDSQNDWIRDPRPLVQICVSWPDPQRATDRALRKACCTNLPKVLHVSCFKYQLHLSSLASMNMIEHGAPCEMMWNDVKWCELCFMCFIVSISISEFPASARTHRDAGLGAGSAVEQCAALGQRIQRVQTLFKACSTDSKQFQNKYPKKEKYPKVSNFLQPRTYSTPNLIIPKLW
jgi:hypothetical protein